MNVELLLLSANILGFASAMTGVTLLTTTSISEHTDVLQGILGVLLIILGFWLRDWKAKREAFEASIREELKAHGISITRLQDSGEEMARILQQYSDDTRRLHRWLYTIFPPDERQVEGDRRRLESLAPRPDPIPDRGKIGDNRGGKD